MLPGVLHTITSQYLILVRWCISIWKAEILGVYQVCVKDKLLFYLQELHLGNNWHYWSSLMKQHISPGSCKKKIKKLSAVLC